MKNTLLFFSFVLLAVVLFTSCHEDKKPITIKENTGYQLTTKNTISPNKYRVWKDRWMRKGVAYTNTTLTEYFTMPLIDLSEFALEDHVAARFVLGMDSTATGYIPHIMLVGVDSTGTSMVPPYAVGKIYDVTRPCPEFCGINSIN